MLGFSRGTEAAWSIAESATHVLLISRASGGSGSMILPIGTFTGALALLKINFVTRFAFHSSTVVTDFVDFIFDQSTDFVFLNSGVSTCNCSSDGLKVCCSFGASTFFLLLPQEFLFVLRAAQKIPSSGSAVAGGSESLPQQPILSSSAMIFSSFAMGSPTSTVTFSLPAVSACSAELSLETCPTSSATKSGRASAFSVWPVPVASACTLCSSSCTFCGSTPCLLISAALASVAPGWPARLFGNLSSLTSGILSSGTAAAFRRCGHDLGELFESGDIRRFGNSSAPPPVPASTSMTGTSAALLPPVPSACPG
mmetsp:Transcript_52377/g.98288  ORF Transcript_52377/g.98288 Transcript_52377/m.98288 type:complete len:312 (+) Transcript_52377:295-1230(+)